MTFTEAAALVLRLVGKPLHYKEITDVAIERSLLSHVGKSPEVTMGSRLSAQVKKAGKDNTIKRVKPGVFALSDWDEKTIEEGLADRTPALERLKKAEAEAEASGINERPEPESEEEATTEPEAVEAAEPAEAPMAAHQELDDDALPPDEDEQHRAELSAGATEMFESEDDDDQPIFGSQEEESQSSQSDSGDGERGDGKRRRRRRRGRGRRDEENSGDDGGDDLPTYTVSDAEPEDLPQSPEPSQDFDISDAPATTSLVGSLEAVLAKYDRAKGPVSVGNIADAMRRKVRGDSSINGAAVLAIATADNLAHERAGGIAKFRVNGNKIALTAWSLDRKAVDRQRALARAADHVRESAVRSVADQLKSMPQRAIGELVLVLLGRMGVSGVEAVRRQGAHGSEMHLSGIVTAGGALRIPTAILVRRDGKDIGRERVTELRGAMHHYGPASSGWVISTGQILSGAREEAQSPGGSPVTLTGRMELAELCVAHGVGVRIHRVEVPVLDVELFENLQGR